MSRYRRCPNRQFELRPGHWLLFFTLAGFALRLQRLNFQPLWGDEGWSFYFAGQPLPQLLALTAADIHPPLYYTLLKVWLFIIGPGPEEARFLSVILGTALIPVVAVLGQRLFDRRVGATAAAVTALMPLAVYYSQEVRMYGLVTLLGAMSVYAFSRVTQPCQLSKVSSRTPAKWSFLYIVSTTAALYTMYYAIFIPLLQLLYLLVIYFQQKDHRARRPIGLVFTLFIYVGLLYLPWVIYAGPRLVSYVQNKRVVEGYLPYNLIHFLGDHVVAFSLGHLPAPLQGYVWAALPFALVAALGFVAGLLRRRTSLSLYLYLLLPLLAGYLINQIFPFTPPYYERTLLLAAPAYWLLIAAGLIWLWDRQYLLVGTVVLAMLLVVAVSLLSFFSLTRYPHQDYRPLLADIAARATPADTLLASYQWQLGFYLAYLPSPRPTFFVVPGWGEGWAGEAGQPRRQNDLAGILARSPRLWFPAHQALGHQWEDETEVDIANLGYPARLEWYSPETKLTLAGGAATLADAAAANFGNLLRLTEARVGQAQYQAGRDIVPVELTWQKEQHLGSDHRVSLRLVDGAGRTWASRDSHPRAGQAFFTDLANGEILADRHGLLISAGTPPGRYRLLLSVRRVHDARPLDLLDSAGQPQGAELQLAEVEVTVPDPPVGLAALPVQYETNTPFGQAVRLVGYSLGDGPFKAGESLPLSLFWASLVDQPGPLTVFVELRDSVGQQVVWHEQPPIWPGPNWRRGDTLRDPHDVRLPPLLPPGQYELAIGLLDSTGIRLPAGQDDEVRLTAVTTIDRPHTFAPPSPQIPLAANFGDRARLVGLDLPQTRVKAGESLPLTLHWQASATFDKNWTVFVHLIDGDGRLVTQQDQTPGDGQFPTRGWLPGEYLADPYTLHIPADTPAGHQAYRLEVGLYDPNDFSRLPRLEAGQIAGDHLILESWPITVE